MNRFLKTILVTLCSAIIALTAHAQDKIYKTNGAVINAKVKSVGDKMIVYKRFDNQDGPEYSILRTEVAKIIYENGTTDIFEGFDRQKKMPHKGTKDKEGKVADKYGKNFFAVTPAAYTVAIDGTINDVGVGVSYERLLDKRGRVGFNLPVMVAFSSNKDYANSIVNVNGTNLTYGNYTALYFMPGIKFYPAPDRIKVRYSIGASFFLIYGGEPAAVYDNNSGVYNPTTGTYTYGNETGTYHYAMYGLMISNSVNIMATNHLYMAFDLGAGLPVSDNRYASGQSLGIPVPFMQIGFKIGYRY